MSMIRELHATWYVIHKGNANERNVIVQCTGIIWYTCMYMYTYSEKGMSDENVIGE